MPKYTFNRNFAVIIGINNYQNNIPSLETAVADARKLAEILQKQHEALKPQYQTQNKYEVQLYLNQRASLKNLNQLIADFKQGQIPFDNEKVTVTKDDRLLFYFAGHGIAKEALENQEGPVGYLIPQDATEDSNTYLPMQDLHDALNALPCRHMLAILDCCFAGAFRWSSLKRDIVPKVKVYKERYDRFISDAAWQVITSAADDQKAVDALGVRGTIQEGSEIHSPFAQALFNALRGTDQTADTHDGIMTATKLYSYLRDQVEVLTEKHFKRQTPTLCPLRKHDKGEFIFLLPNFDRDKLEDAPPLNKENNPYLGLQSYDEKDSHLFFGREHLIRELYGRVVYEQQGLTVILGASGTGKSSLMKAGLLKCLRDSEEQKFEILNPIRPGETPLQALTQAFFPILDTITAKELEEDEQALANIVKNWSQTNPQTKILLAVDQYEELITLCKSDEEREQFQNLIKNAIAKSPNNIHIVITLRLDFEAQFQNSVLKDFWNNATRFVVPPMTQDELREAIEKPASEKVVYFEPPSLVDKLINEVVQMPGALPLLSFTLSELYLKYLEERRDNRALTEKDYEELGRVVGSLTKRANQEYEHLVAKDTAYQNTIRRVMLRMIALQGGELARRQVPKWELEYPDKEENDRVQTLIKHFSEARLIVEGSNSQGEPYVEPAHDALVMGWDKLLAWKKEEEENIILQRRLTPAAKEWETVTSKLQPLGWQTKTDNVIDWLDRILYVPENLFNKVNVGLTRRWQQRQNQQKTLREKPIQFLWNSNPYLDVLNQLLQANNNWFNQIETEFVQESILQKRRNISWRWRIAITVIVGLSGLTIAALIGQRNAQLNLTVSFKQASEADLRSDYQELNALLSGLRSAKSLNHPLLQLFPPNEQVQNQVRGTLQKAFYRVRERNILKVSESGVNNIIFSRKSSKIAIIQRDGNVHLWDWKSNKLEQINLPNEVKNIFASGGRYHSASFSPDAQQFIIAMPDGTVSWWDLNGNKVDEFKIPTQESSTRAFFSSNYHQVAIVTDDNTVTLWGTKSKQRLRKPFKIVENRIEGVIKIKSTFSRFGTNIPTFQAPIEPKDIQRQIKYINFSRDNKTLNIITYGQEDTSVVSWNFERNKLYNFKLPQTENKKFISFSSDGKLMATLSNEKNTQNDYIVSLWNIENQKKLRHNIRIPYTPEIIFSSYGQQIITYKYFDYSVKYETPLGKIDWWDLDGRKLDEIDPPYPAQTVPFFSPNLQQVAFVEANGTLHLWDWNEKYLKKIDLKLNPSLGGADFSPNLETIAIAEEDKNIVSLWDWKGKFVNGFQMPGEVENVMFTPDGKQIIANGTFSSGNSSAKSFVYLGDWQGKQLTSLNRRLERVLDIHFIHDKGQLATLEKNSDRNEVSINVWDLNGNNLENFNLPKTHEDLTEFLFSPNGKFMAISYFELGDIYLWDWERKKELDTSPLQPYKSPDAGDMSFSPDGSLLATVGSDKEGRLDSGFSFLRLWGLDGKIFKEIQLNPSASREAFSLDGKLIATISGSHDGTVRVWDLQGNQIAEFIHQELINSFSFASNSQLLATIDDNGVAKMWQIEGLDELVVRGCDWVRGYLENNPNVSESDRNLCDDVPTVANTDQ